MKSKLIRLLPILCALAFSTFAAEPPKRPDLLGVVKDFEGKVPLKKATVFIFSAGPRVGSTPYCPTCYPDCRKSDLTGKDGKFKINELDPQLIFRVLAVAKGYKPFFLGKVDPDKGPIEIELEKLDRENLRPNQMLGGRVLDPDGKPIHGAVVNFDNYTFADGGGRGGMVDGVDLVAVTDDNGEFLLTTQQPFATMGITVEARSYAKRKFFDLLNTKKHDLKMTEGASVKGVVLRDGKPAPDVTVGIVSVDRGRTFTGEFQIGTTEDGTFMIPNLPPNQEYYIYGIMDSLKGNECIPATKIKLGTDGSTFDAGKLRIQPGHRLAGRVVLADGKPIPRKNRITISREDAWDSRIVELKEDGSFDVQGLPTESYSVTASVNRYRVSNKNPSLDKLNGGSLVGIIDKDIRDLVILLEPGEFERPDYSTHEYSPDDQPTDKPLRGAPTASVQ